MKISHSLIHKVDPLRILYWLEAMLLVVVFVERGF